MSLIDSLAAISDKPVDGIEVAELIYGWSGEASISRLVHHESRDNVSITVKWFIGLDDPFHCLITNGSIMTVIYGSSIGSLTLDNAPTNDATDEFTFIAKSYYHNQSAVDWFTNYLRDANITRPGDRYWVRSYPLERVKGLTFGHYLPKQVKSAKLC